MNPPSSLARPGASDVVNALERELPATRIAAAIGDGLTAETITKSGARIPDHRSRLAAAELALKYLVGLPVQRTESINVNLDADATTGLAERLRSSPALREQMRKMLEASEI